MIYTYTPGQFRRFLESAPKSTFVYDTENQPDDSGTISVSQRFTEAHLFLLPPTLALKNAAGYMVFAPLNSIIVDDSEPAIGTIITAVCDEWGREKRYVLLMDRVFPTPVWRDEPPKRSQPELAYAGF